MTDLAKWQLRGAVKTLREEHAEWDPSAGTWGPPRHLTVVTFRADGRLSGREFHNPDASIARYLQLYDRDGRLVETQSWMDDGPKRRQLYSYDTRGRLAEVVNVEADGTRTAGETSRYDQAGRRTTVRFLAVPRGDLAMTYGVEGSEIAYSTPGAATSTTTYDEHERPAEVSFHDAEHALISRIVLARDRDGRLLSEINYFEGETPRFDHQTGLENVSPEDRAKLDSLLATVFERQTFSSTTYAYDQNGRVLQRTQKMGRLSEDRTTYRYDDRGNRIEETTYSEHRSVNIDDDGVVHPAGEERLAHIVRYDYKYDSHGNWTERVVRGRASAEQDFRQTNVTWRTIAYYGP